MTYNEFFEENYLVDADYDIIYFGELSEDDKKLFIENNAKGYFKLTATNGPKRIRELWTMHTIDLGNNNEITNKTPIIITPFDANPNHFSKYIKEKLKNKKWSFRLYDEYYINKCKEEYDHDDILKNEIMYLDINELSLENQESLSDNNYVGLIEFDISSDLSNFHEIWHVDNHIKNQDSSTNEIKISPYSINPYKNSFIIPAQLFNKEIISYRPLNYYDNYQYHYTDNSFNFEGAKFFREMAYKLVEYKDNYRNLGKRFSYRFEEYREELPDYPIYNQFYYSADPFMVYGFLNIPMKNEQRIKLVEIATEVLEWNTDIPHNFDGCCTYDYGLFENYAYTNYYNCKTRLWDLLESSLKYSENQSMENKKDFIVKYDDARDKKALSYDITTMLYLINPTLFIPLNTVNRLFFKDPFALSNGYAKEFQRMDDVPPAKAYLKLCERLNKFLNNRNHEYKNFLELSAYADNYEYLEFKERI